MAHYAIGDVQGCRAALEDLLERIAFDPAVDRLYFAGDLVARGPDSLGTLRLIHGLGPLVADSVLGNHDLHLIAVHHGLARARSKDNTQAILDAPDRQPLMDWLQQRHLLLELPGHHVLTHAGIPPVWSLAQARQHAREVEQALRGPDARDFLAAMYGNEPAGWDDSLAGTTRLRVITNFLTRMRLLDPQGGLDFAFKGSWPRHRRICRPGSRSTTPASARRACCSGIGPPCSVMPRPRRMSRSTMAASGAITCVPGGWRMASVSTAGRGCNDGRRDAADLSRRRCRA